MLGRYHRSAAIGAASGLRTFIGAAWWAARATPARTTTPLERWLATPAGARIMALCSGAELIADKLPFVPDRVRPGPLAARVLMGGLLGAASARAPVGERWVVAVRQRLTTQRRSATAQILLGGVIGAVCAVGAAFTGYHVRRGLTRRGLPDMTVAVAEDGLAATLAVLATSASNVSRLRRTRNLTDGG